MTETHLIALPGIALAGFAFGLAYFAALSRTTRLLAAGRGWAGPAALTVGRIAATVGLLIVAARIGPIPLLATFGGFLAARLVAARYQRKAG